MASQPPTTGPSAQGQQQGGPQPQPQQGQGQAGAGERPLNVRDALSYLDQVKVSARDRQRREEEIRAIREYDRR